MKKILFILTVLSIFGTISAQSHVVCTDLSVNLVRGVESKNVLALQNFLYFKGLLKAMPNGYFGPGTFAAVKAYQKSLGLSQVGNSGPATRAAIKKETCSTPSASTQQQTAATTPQIAPVTVSSPAPRPVLDFIDSITLFEGGQTDWGFAVYGGNFSTSTSNRVSLRNTSSGRTYTIGTYASASGTTIFLPANLTATAFSCGIGCNEKLPAGFYELTVANDGGISSPRTLTIKSFTITAQTGSLQNALVASASNLKFGSLTFSPAVPIIVKSIVLNTASSTISSGGLSGIILKNELSGAAFAANATLTEFQSLIIGAYVTTNNTIPGEVTANFIVEIEDYIGKKTTKFTSPSFLVTVAGVL